MNDKSIKTLTITLLIFVGITLIFFMVSTALDGYWIWKQGKIDFTVTGQFGDFVGGFLGTIINGAVFYFIYLTLNEQRKSTLKQSFETKIFDLINLHRNNVSELRYTKYDKDKFQTSESRKVFRVIVQEFLDCLYEVKKFSKMYPDYEIIKPEYKDLLSKIKKINNCRARVQDLAFIDLAFCYLYFGVSKETDTILLHKFYNRYNRNFTTRLKVFLQLKPKRENTSAYSLWEDFKNLGVAEMKELFEENYLICRKPNQNITHKVFTNLFLEKYYGGHQHRLGHYFRHLFQSFKYLSLQTYLSPDEKYFYAKTLRAQLSTYEQYLLFFNSLSSLGMKWEYTAELPNPSSNLKLADFKFITRYNLIKNMPGSQYYDFSFRKYYPNVKYDFKEDISYYNDIADKLLNNTSS